MQLRIRLVANRHAVDIDNPLCASNPVSLFNPSRTTSAGLFVERTKFYYTAKAGFEKSVAILRGDTTPYDALGENWAQEMEEQIEDASRVGNALTYRVSITDEESKVNLNSADVNVIQGLLGTVGHDVAESAEQTPLADAIVEGRPYRTVLDLARIEGMTQELLYGRRRLTQGFSAVNRNPDAAEGFQHEGSN